MSLRVRSFPDRGALVWFAITAGIAAWMLHLIGFAVLVAFVHTNGFFWLFTVGNVAMIAVTVLAGFLCCLMIRAGHDDESAGTPEGRMRFLGYVGLAANGANLLLILLEGSYVYFIRTGG
jgi:hypothetical protein